MTSKINHFAVWIQAIRVFSLTASVTPVLLGGAWAFHEGVASDGGLLPIFLICAVLFHSATNLISDYYDFLKGVDRDYTFGSSGVLVKKLLSPQQVRAGAFWLFGLGFILGLTLVVIRGMPIFVLGVIGILGGYLYTAKPVGYKYWALGDVMVFLLMGVFLVAGAYYAISDRVDLRVILISLPISSLVAAILHANNTRDIVHDRGAGVRTLAGVLGHRKAQREYYVLIGAAYVGVVVLILAAILKPWAGLVFLSLPLAVRNIQEMSRSRENEAQDLASLDVKTAKLHLLFGVLMTIAIGLSGWSA